MEKRMDRRVLRVEKEVIRVERRVLRVDKRVLRVEKQVLLQVNYESCEWPRKYYEWPDGFCKYYEWQDGFCDNNYPEIISSLVYESKISVFLLEIIFGKSLFVMIIYTCIFI